MPIRKVNGGYKWGESGKVYPNRAGAQRQAQAAYASGYKGFVKGGHVKNEGITAVNIPTPKAAGLGQDLESIFGTGGGITNAAATAWMNEDPSLSITGTPTNIPWPGGKPGGTKKRTSGRGTPMARMKEYNKMKKLMREVARKIDPQTYIDQGYSEEAAIKMAQMQQKYVGTPNDVRKFFQSKNMGPGSVVGTTEELRAAGINALPSALTSYGMPKNWETEIYPYYEEQNTFEGAPAPGPLQSEIDALSSLGIRSVPTRIAQNIKPGWWPENLPWGGRGG